MRWIYLFPLVLLAFAKADESDELPLAEECDEELCQLPSCRCSSVDIPGGLNPRDTPQFVTLTFDDAVNTINIMTYRDVLIGRKNKNDCPIGTTFYVNHGWTDYISVNELHNAGFEIGLRSITQQIPQEYWRNATYEVLMKEFADQKTQMAHFANIPASEIYGIRSPFLQLAGNETFKMLVSSDLLYDSSWPTISFTDPGLWPYTLNYQSIQDCVSPPCPTASIPGPWVIPMLAWFDLNNSPCSTMNACFYAPDVNDEDEWFRFMLRNFEKQYLGNRAPFGIYANEGHINAHPAVRRAFVRFLDLLNNLNDVFMVNAREVIDWVKDPVPIDQYRQQACRTFTRTTCTPTFCGPLSAEHSELSFYMTICNSRCPNVYPWLGNPLGL